MKSRFLFLPLVSLALVSCSSSNFPQFNALGPLRVLTIKALSDQSEVNPGTSGVVLQPVISDYSGGGRTLSVNVQTCVDPGVAFGATVQCANPDSNVNSSFSSTTLGSNDTYTGEAPTFTVNVPNVPLPTAVDQYNGIAYLVIYTISAADGSSVTAFKRVLVTAASKTTKNKNPALSGVTDNGVTLTPSDTYSGATQNFTPSFSVGAETYQVLNPNGSYSTFSESLTTTWFITDGSMQFEHTTGTDTDVWTPSRTAAQGVAIVVVTHDNRGGEDYSIFQLN